MIAEAIAAWYTPAQLSSFVLDCGLPPIGDAEAVASAEELSAHLAAYGQGSSDERRTLRRFLAAFLHDDLDPFADGDEREELITILAEAGWHLREDDLVAGEQVAPGKPRVKLVTPEVAAREREEAIAQVREAHRQRDLARERARASEAARKAAEEQIALMRKQLEAERAEQQKAAAKATAERAPRPSRPPRRKP